MTTVNSGQKLYVTPEERARRMAAQQNGGRHPHGGEGNCGGNEGHGTPDLLRKQAENQKKTGKGNAAPNASAQAQATGSPKKNAHAVKPAASSLKTTGAPSREQLASAMKLSFALGEPACRRFGLRSPYQRKGF